ncbi:ZIP-like iron-zinc transporter [Sistotremastrum niveocremeum HHB9708]|uniref:ZIP-like iron-zinc transporter n=2 Tax=Sistotremastraceae TaxID=3402574 RepID=A0A164TLJ6_9AGAM|nr:ZIP-like iron-zinc transporter [Sistotremastrum niveocremeum HHB9708]KZT42134.1 ZIP-like iron-zinc transporter [Sistotremastrum suecicum HHB10207 ss-3]
MMAWRQHSLFVSLLILSLLLGCVQSKITISENDLQQCKPVQALSALKIEVDGSASTLTRRVFDVLFPFGPGWNSILATFYISSVPNFILAFIPEQINSDTLNTMTAFATGGLLSDVFLHLVPHSFMGEHQHPGVHVIMVDEKRNIIIGLAIFVGFAAFFVMEKTFRVLGDEEDARSPSHTHSHSHDNSPNASLTTGQSTGVAASGTDALRSRSGKSTDLKEESDVPSAPVAKTSKLSAYLNLMGDFTHNITDGLAMAASFYASPLIGATTTLACFAHEIPHEIADYSILIRSGFTKRQAMGSQFLTAVGAFVGTFMGIAIHNYSSSGTEHGDTSADLTAAVRGEASGLLGTTVVAGDLVIPFVAGGFMYIGAVAVLPTLLQESRSGKQALKEMERMISLIARMKGRSSKM